MSTPRPLDERINALTAEIDEKIRTELKQILLTLRQGGYPVGVVLAMSRLALRLFRLIYDAASKPWPSDNLFDVIVRAAKGDPEKKIPGYSILPDRMDVPLHTIRILSNQADHAAEQFQLGVELAESVLNAFLSVLRWFYCESRLVSPLSSLYSATGPPAARSMRFTCKIEGDVDTWPEENQRGLLSAIGAILRGGGSVEVVQLDPGSILMTILLAPHEVDVLLEAIRTGKLREYGVVDGWVERQPLYLVRAVPHAPHAPPFRLAWGHDGRPRTVHLSFLNGAGQRASLSPSRLFTPEQRVDGEHLAVTLALASGPDAGHDEETRVTLSVGEQVCEVRRSTCVIECGLLGTREEPCVLPLDGEAALRWFCFGRFDEVVLLKQFTGGFTGSCVYVARPRLRAGEGGLPPSAWGAPLLLKIGPTRELAREADNYERHLAGRLYPFVARTEAFLTVRHPDNKEGPDLSLLVSSFVGGSESPIESLESLVRGEAGEEACLQALGRLFDNLSHWYEAGVERPLAEWTRVYDPATRLVCRRYDFNTPEGRRQFRGEDGGGLNWDLSFSEPHMRWGLLGRESRGQPGLLDVLSRLTVRFSLAHGDMHPRNVLAGRDGAWLIDFGRVGAGPTLFDFARLEVGLRLWCLDLDEGNKGLEAGAVELEQLLLDLLLGGQSSLTPVADIAGRMGACPRRLQRVAACISLIRRRALPYTTGRPDRRDYLAVLFLTVLATLRYASREPQHAGGFRLLVELYWSLERRLCRLFGLTPFQRRRAPLNPRLLVDAEWLAAPCAPARVHYYLSREDGRLALPEVADLRGVLQNDRHRLDCFDHALLVLAHLEALLENPWEALTDPGSWERRVESALADQGLDWSALRHRPPTPRRPDLGPIARFEEQVRALLDRALPPRRRLMLKWLALLHDVGKPATRCLNQKGSGAVVQMLGHENFGSQLAGGVLRHLFGEDDATRMVRLVADHTWPHNLATELLDKEGEKLATLRGALAAPGPPKLPAFCRSWGEHDEADFVSLLLHGYADRAACGGWAYTETLDELAGCYLTVLAAFAASQAPPQRGPGP
jgi:hypothetical protein